MSAPQVSWKVIESGARVFSSEGRAVGTVDRVVGDATADVFTGLALSVDVLGPARFVASERVAGIWVDRVDIDLTEEQIKALPEHEEQQAVRWRPGRRGLLGRLFGR